MKKGVAPNVSIEDRGYKTPCHIWQGYIHPRTGYGMAWNPLRKKHGTAHRAAYEAKHGLTPPAHDLDHLCRVRSCVNDEHLEPVPHLINVRRGDAGQHFAKLTEQAKRAIAYCIGQPAPSIAALYGVTVRRVYQIRKDPRYA